MLQQGGRGIGGRKGPCGGLRPVGVHLVPPEGVKGPLRGSGGLARGILWAGIGRRARYRGRKGPCGDDAPEVVAGFTCAGIGSPAGGWWCLRGCGGRAHLRGLACGAHGVCFLVFCASLA